MNIKRLPALVLPILFLILVSCSLPTRTPTTPQASPTITPTVTLTTPGGLASQTPPSQSGTSSPNISNTTETPNPTVTPAGSGPSQSLQPGTYDLFLIYTKDTKDDKFDYFESMNITGTFTLAADGSQAGKGEGIYKQGLESLNPAAFTCGLPVTAFVTMDIKGTADANSTPLLFHQNIVVTFQPLIATMIQCTATAVGMTVSMPLSGTTEELNLRAAGFPWNDYQINPVLGLYSALIDGEGIDWKKTGGGELTIAIRRQP